MLNHLIVLLEVFKAYVSNNIFLVVFIISLVIFIRIFWSKILELYKAFLLRVFEKHLKTYSLTMGRFFCLFFLTRTRIMLIQMFIMFLNMSLIILLQIILFPWLHFVSLKTLIILFSVIFCFRILISIILFSLTYWAIILDEDVNLDFFVNITPATDFNTFIVSAQIKGKTKEIDERITEKERKVFEEYAFISQLLCLGYLEFHYFRINNKFYLFVIYCVTILILWLIAYIFS